MEFWYHGYPQGAYIFGEVGQFLRMTVLKNDQPGVDVQIKLI